MVHTLSGRALWMGGALFYRMVAILRHSWGPGAPRELVESFFLLQYLYPVAQVLAIPPQICEAATVAFRHIKTTFLTQPFVSKNKSLLAALLSDKGKRNLPVGSNLALGYYLAVSMCRNATVPD